MALMFAGACTDDTTNGEEQSTTATIRGKVTDCNGAALADIRVTAGQATAVTNATGDYTAVVPANAPLMVSVKSEDYGNYSPEVSHLVPGQAGGNTFTRNISLPCLSVPPNPAEKDVTIKGKVTDCKGAALPNIKVTVGTKVAVTSSAGEYSATAAANTAVTVTVKSADYGNYSPVVSHNIAAQAGGTVITRDISLPCLEDPATKNVTIKGKVTDCKGAALPNIKVTVGTKVAVTSSAGEYSAEVPPNTAVAVTVKSEDYGNYLPFVSYDIAAQAGGTVVTRDINLPCLEDPAAKDVTIKGKVTDCKGAALPNIKVTVGTKVAVTSSAGEYSAEVPPNTAVTVTVKSADYGNYSPVVSHNIAAQAGGAVVTRDISLPCLADNPDPGLPGSPAEGSVLYDYVIDGSHNSWLETWKGGRGILERQDICMEGMRTTMIGSKRESIIWLYTSYTGWMSQPWNDNGIIGGGDTNSNMRKIGTMTVLNRTCDLYEVIVEGAVGKVAIWETILMYQETVVEGATIKRTAVALKIGNIPDKAFTKTLDIDWISGFKCP
ncbi:hypothetical protein FACS1894181_06170 [Bacteroidia bacterium]|nr:hypothetical protein FACS1894181_06170 [Bacteroidia bacterium]